MSSENNMPLTTHADPELSNLDQAGPDRITRVPIFVEANYPQWVSIHHVVFSQKRKKKLMLPRIFLGSCKENSEIEI